MMVSFIPYLLNAVIVTAWLLILGRVLMSWVDPTFSKPIGQFLYSMTEPLLGPIRRVLPRTGNFDLSPVVLLLGLGLLMRITLAAT